jgi:MFS family permease
VLLKKTVLLTLPVFLTGSLRYTILNILIQYSSNRFNLKISAGALFYTETAVVNMFLFLLLVPTFTGYLRKRYDVRPQNLDLFMCRTGVVLLALGSLFMGLSPSRRVLPMGKFEGSLLPYNS